MIVIQLLLHPVLQRMFRVIGDDALEGIQAALLAHSRQRTDPKPPPADAPPAALGVSVESVRLIVARDDQPVRRNLLITQHYWQISQRLAELFGEAGGVGCGDATRQAAAPSSGDAQAVIPEYRLAPELPAE